MRIAERIQQIRLEQAFSLADVAARAGMPASLIDRLENGRDVPTIEMLDTLAGALDVPEHRFFYDEAELLRTPRLTPRVPLRELMERCQRRAVPAHLSKPRSSVVVVIRALLDWITRPPGRK